MEWLASIVKGLSIRGFFYHAHHADIAVCRLSGVRGHCCRVRLWPLGIAWSHREFGVESLRRLSRLACIVVPGHGRGELAGVVAAWIYGVVCDWHRRHIRWHADLPGCERPSSDGCVD